DQLVRVAMVKLATRVGILLPEPAGGLASSALRRSRSCHGMQATAGRSVIDAAKVALARRLQRLTTIRGDAQRADPSSPGTIAPPCGDRARQGQRPRRRLPLPV